VAACRHHDLPLFSVSPEVSFSTITERVVQRLSAGRSGDLAAVLGRHRHLIASGGGLSDVLNLVHDELGMECQVISATGRLIRATPAAGDQPDADARAAIAARAGHDGRLPRRLNHGGHAYSVFDIGAASHCGWFLVVDDDHTQWPPQRRDVAEELVALIALEADRRLRRPQAEQDLIDSLDSGGDPAGKLAAAGVDDGWPLSVAVCSAGDSPELAAAVTDEAIAPSSHPIAWAVVKNDVIAVLGPRDSFEDFVHQVRRRVRALSPGLPDAAVSIGVSYPVNGADALVGALEEARHAERLAAARGDDAVAGPDELTSHVLLTSAVPPEVRRTFHDRVLGPLIDYDAQHHSDLVSTVEQFLECEGSWSKCADKLHLHVNTLRYRIERVERLTGRDLRRLSDRVDLFLALRLR
jgi:hypothetical protein